MKGKNCVCIKKSTTLRQWLIGDGKNCVCIKKSTTLRQWLIGDHDDDGVKNIDDLYPLDKSRGSYPLITKNPSYYHKARFGGTEAKLSDELLAIERYNNRHAPVLKNFLKKHPGSYGRIKTVASTIEKLRTGHIEDISDIAATTLVHEKRDDIFVRVKDLKKEHKTKQSEEDNFYEKPLDNVYYAHHMTVLGEKKKALEVQLKTRKMRELQDEMHADYKARKSLEQYKQRAKKLYEEGF